MLSRKLLSKALISALVLSGCILAGLPTLTWAGGNPGLTIFGGVDRKDILDYYLDFDGVPNQRDRYKLYVPAKKLERGASKFFISYPANFDGKFDVNAVEVRVKGESLPLKEVYWDKESRFLEITLDQPVQANTNTDIVLSNVQNPSMGTYYLVCDVVIAGEVPVRLYLGTWIVSIERG
jgi:hypothetical protein